MSKRIIRMIASDVDGTLMRSDRTLSRYTIDTIHRAQEKDILFIICSGRYPEHADVLMKAHGIRCPIVGNNGCTLWDPEKEKVLSDHFLSKEAAEKACDWRGSMEWRGPRDGCSVGPRAAPSLCQPCDGAAGLRAVP